jgi:hypothetical protein
MSQGGCVMAPHIVSRSNFILPLFVFLLFSQPILSALGQNAQIAGTVTDPSKAVIPNASIEIVETATQVKWDTISNGDGRYVAPSLAPGVNQITVQAPNFETQIVGNLPLNGRSLQSLMALAPDVLVVPSQGVGQSGELSVNANAPNPTTSPSMG